MFSKFDKIYRQIISQNIIFEKIDNNGLEIILSTIDNAIQRFYKKDSSKKEFFQQHSDNPFFKEALNTINYYISKYKTYKEYMRAEDNEKLDNLKNVLIQYIDTLKSREQLSKNIISPLQQAGLFRSRNESSKIFWQD